MKKTKKPPQNKYEETKEKIQTLRAEAKRHKYMRDDYLSLYNSLRNKEPTRADFYLKLANKTTAALHRKNAEIKQLKAA